MRPITFVLYREMRESAEDRIEAHFAETISDVESSPIELVGVFLSAVEVDKVRESGIAGKGQVTVDYTLLKTIHRILRQKSDLQDRIVRGPRQIAVAENAEKQFAAELETAREIRKKTQMMADEKQVQLGQRENRIVDMKAKLNAAESNREYQLLKDQIAADEQASSVLSDEILEMLERLDGLVLKQETAKENLEKGKQETEKVRNRVNRELATLNDQLAEVVEELNQHESRLSGDFAVEYRRLAAKKGEDALAETDLQTCGSCFTRITTQMMSELMMKKPVFCKSCGCLLYTGEKSATVN